MNEIKISEIIRKLRSDKGISQETLADVCDVSMQAVSKWENGQSCPDIIFLPLLAEYFGVSVDYLLTGQNYTAENADNHLISNLPKDEFKDDVLYILQYRNGKILAKQQWNKKQPENRDTAIRIQFADEFAHFPSELHIEVWGNADIETPDVKMNLNAGGNVNCGTVQGHISAGASVNCDVVEGNVSAGNNVTCETIEGCASAGNYIACDTIEGNAQAGTRIEYKNN